MDVFAVWEGPEYKNFHCVQQKYLYHNYRELKQGDKGWGWYWSGWTLEHFGGGATQHAPAIVTFEPNSFDRQEVFIRQENGHLERKTWLSGVKAAKRGKEEGWRSSGLWEDLDDTGSGLISAPSAVRSAEGQHIDFFSVNVFGYLQHRREENGGKPTA